MEQSPLQSVRSRVDQAAARAGTRVRLLAVAKRQPDGAVRALAAGGQVAFAENYVQALQRRRRQSGLDALEWHLIGPLQSNKLGAAAAEADWVQSIDRIETIAGLAARRPAALTPLNLLVQVNIDAELGKSGCTHDAAAGLCDAIEREPRLKLRGLMAIPRPSPSDALRVAAFSRMRDLFDELVGGRSDFDTLSMGMSEDFELAIAAGSTMVRVGTALFGARTAEEGKQ